MTTREQAIADAGRVLAEGRRAAAAMSVKDAARAAFTPTGPSIEELESRIRAQRAAAAPPVPWHPSDAAVYGPRPGAA